MKKQTTKLHFKKDELKDENVSKAYKRAKRAVNKADKAKSKLITEEEKSATRKAKLRFGEAEIAVDDIKTPSKTKRALIKGASSTISAKLHQEVGKNEDDNVGVKSFHRSEEIAESSVRTVNNAIYGNKLRKSRQAEKLEAKADKANINTLYQKQKSVEPKSVSNPISKWRQKQQIKKEYMAAKSGKSVSTTTTATQTVKDKVKKASEQMVSFATRHSHTLVIGAVAVMLLFILSTALSSCSVMFQGGSNMVVGASFTATDEAIIGANDDYKALESELQSKIEKIEEEHTGYDEYRYYVDDINHNPYELTSYLTVVFEDYMQDEVQDSLQELFDLQYSLTLEEETETRTKTETRTGTKEVVDPETGETRQEEYEYEVEVEYEYKILNVKLKNNGLGSAINQLELTDEQKERYRLLLETKGNRSYLFEDDIYANSTGEYLDYDIPGEALTDEKFANMIKEAEKYLGYPYVWGGSSPETSFDCSGFVSWVINHSNNGWNVGRLGANGLKNICDIIRPNEAKPGDLIFFQGTYDTTGASHVGIYVGNGMMIHCGNPISYAHVNSSYWQEHFYCYGRLK